MGRQIIVQPDELLAVWSTVVDDWIFTDATSQEVLDFFAQEAADNTRLAIARIINDLLDDKAKRHYGQFTMTWDEAERVRKWRHEGGPEPTDG